MSSPAAITTGVDVTGGLDACDSGAVPGLAGGGGTDA